MQTVKLNHGIGMPLLGFGEAGKIRAIGVNNF